MNRKNLTAAVLAGLAGIAGIAGTAQAVNLNPDGLGQVLIYPYYTSNAGNHTLLSVVNTTDAAKAVKVRFLEGFNSREVLDFNLYLSAWDVWAAAIDDVGGVPTLYIGDDSCTVPYLYPNGTQEFLNFAYNDHPPYFSNDGGPTGIDRAAEGHIEIIEMGTVQKFIDGSDKVHTDTWDAITHVTHDVLDADGKVIGTEWKPGDCDLLVENWTRGLGDDANDLGDWILNPTMDIGRNSGGLFGGAAIINPENGTMYSYNAAAIQGFDKTDGLLHREPGGVEPSLNDGNQHWATIFFGVPSNKAVTRFYGESVGAISALFMRETLMNEYMLEETVAASTEWVITFPTKSFYVDADLVGSKPSRWVPDGDDLECNSWIPGESYPIPGTDIPVGPTGEPVPNPINPGGAFDDWAGCTYIKVAGAGFGAQHPFTTLFDGQACEDVSLRTWDRDERTFKDERGGTQPPVVSPSIPSNCDPVQEFCPEAPFQLCYEVNVMRFGEGEIFGTPNFGTEEAPYGLLLTVEDEFVNGWGRIDFSTDVHHQDEAGLIGLPALGFAAYEFENSFVDGGDVKAFYGGLFGHRGNVRSKSQHVHPAPSE